MNERALQSRWFVAALATEVTPQPSSVMLFGRPMVLVRNDGIVWALEDRCPHRGVPLSAGCLTAKGLECPYHGWTFDGDGICRDMPGEADETAGDVRVPAFDVLEHDGLVWVRGRSAAHRDRPLPERITCLDPSQQHFLGQSTWDIPVLDAQARFLEVRRAVQATFTVAGDGFVIDYESLHTRFGLLMRLLESRRLSERAWFSGLSVGQLEFRYANGSTVWITLCFSPRDERSTQVVAMLHLAGSVAPRWLLRSTMSALLRPATPQDHGAVPPQGLVRAYVDAAWDDC